MRDESFYFLRVGELGRRIVVTCDPEDDILHVADVMREKKVSGVVVCRAGEPVGIITDRDFRTRLREITEASGELSAAQLMSAPVTTIGENERLFEAVYQMGKNRIHRLVVVDAAGQLAGIITDADLIKLQLSTPMYLGRDIEEAQSLDDLREIYSRTRDVVAHALRSGGKTSDVIRLIAHFHDSITQKVIEFLLRDSPDDVPDGFGFLALGSEGRSEQTLKTDQDNAIVYDDDLSDAEVASLATFSERLIAALVQIGVPPCPGGTMANNPQWRKSLSEWSGLVEHWILVPRPEDMVNFGMLCDLRTLYGHLEYERRLKEVMIRAIRQNSLFLALMARNILRFPPPLGLFGRLKVERAGPNKGKIDLKKAGIFAITEGVTLLALEAGIVDGGTREKISALREGSALPSRTLDELEGGIDFLSHLRLTHQLAQIKRGNLPDNCVDPAELSYPTLVQLKETLGAIESFQRYLREKFKLDLIPH